MAPERCAGASWQALGTGVALRLSEPGALGDARAAVEHELDAIDLACSRFRADSELTRLNRAGGRACRVGGLLIEALEVALRAAELTEGDVDPTLGRWLELAGYDRDFSLLQAAPAARQSAAVRIPVLRARVRSGWRSVELDRERGTARVPAGALLDLGATAKAWAADRAAAAALGAGARGALVAIGGDLATAGVAPPEGWRVHVTDDHRSDSSAPGQTIAIRSGGLATSSTAVRRWLHGGRAMHHVIDPSSGEPVHASWRTVSVAAATCTDANIAATAALVRAAGAPQWLESLGLPARLLDWRGEVVGVGGWPATGARPAPRAGERPRAGNTCAPLEAAAR